MNTRPETIKFLEENIGRKLFDAGLASLRISVFKGNKIKINTWDYIKLKGFCTVKKIIKR